MTQSNLELFENFPWHETSLGPPEDWPVEMRSVVQALMASSFPICTGWGKDTIQIYNDAYNEIFGDKHPESFGAPLKDTWPEIWDFVSEAADRIRRSGEPLVFRDTMLPLAKTGVPEECYFDFSYSAVKDLGGSVIGLMSIAKETTAEVVSRRRQAALEIPSDLHSGNVMEAISEALRKILSENEIDCRTGVLFRVSPENGVPLNSEWIIRGNADFAASVRPIVAMALARTEDRVVKLPDAAKRADIADEAVVVPISDDHAQLVAVLFLVPDPLVPIKRSLLPFVAELSRRVHGSLHFLELKEKDVRLAREQMTEQSTMYRFLFENMGDGAIYTATSGQPDDEEIVLAVNNRACELLGYDAEDVIGMHRASFFFPEDEDLEFALSERSKKGFFVGDLTFRAKNGAPIPVEVTSNIFKTSAGETRSVSIIRDLASRKIRALEREERTRSEVIASLTRAVAHDFNNLLTVVLGSLDVLEDSFTDDESRLRLVRSAARAAEEAGNLTSQLLTYSRRKMTKPRLIEIGAFLEEIQPLLVSALGETIALDIKLGDGSDYCWADPSALISGLMNLVTNARHAMPEGGNLLMSVSVVRKRHFYPSHDTYALPHDQYLALVVRDEGIGIPDEIRNKIFEPFFTTKQIGDGTGLGLPTALEAIRQIGGDLRLSPERGNGAAFQILLPLNCQDKPLKNETSDNLHGRGEVVLYVEDNALVREQTVLMLQHIGFSPLVAIHGREALEIAKSDQKIDIAFTDLVMPGGLSGRALAKELKRIRPELPVVITTGYDPEDHAYGEDLEKILRKPYSRDELAKALVNNLV